MARNIKNTAASVHQRLLSKAKLADAPEAFEDVVEAVKMFIQPLVVSLKRESPFRSVWTAPGRWR